MEHPEAILFDLDNTLIKERESADHSFRQTVSGILLNISDDEFVKLIREEAKKLWYSLPTIDYCLKVGISSWEALWADFDGEDPNLQLLKEHVDEYRFNAWKNTLMKVCITNDSLALKLGYRFKELRNKRHVLYSDTIPCLEQLKGKYKLGLITNGAPDIQWKKINGGHLKNYFNNIVISGNYGTGKPDPLLFDVAFRDLKAEKNRVIVIGDNLKTDITGAKNAGIKSIWINRHGRKNALKNIQPDYELRNLFELVKLLN